MIPVLYTNSGGETDSGRRTTTETGSFSTWSNARSRRRLNPDGGQGLQQGLRSSFPRIEADEGVLSDVVRLGIDHSRQALSAAASASLLPLLHSGR